MADTRNKIAQSMSGLHEIYIKGVGGGGGRDPHKRTLHRFQPSVEVTTDELHPFLFPTKMQTKKLQKLFMTK